MSNAAIQAEEALDYLRAQGENRKFYGLYRGRIEDIDDPDRVCRVKVRVWAVHGDKVRWPKTALPWAEVPDEGGGGYDFGSYDPYTIGSSVWLGFEMGDPDIPVIIGGFRGEPLRDDDNPNVFLVDDQEPPVETSWLPPDGELETPKDVFDEAHANDPHPTRRVWKKSFKGHTIVVDDGDGKEFFKIIDRAGQILEFDCAVKADVGKGNAAQRGTRDAIRGDQMSHAAMVDKYAHIRLVDLSGQQLLLSAQDREEFVELRSRNKLGSAESYLRLLSGFNNKGIELKDSGGNYLRFNPDGNEPIRLQDGGGNAIVFDKNLGTIKMVCAKTASAEMPQQSLTVLGKKDVEVRGDEIKRILGNKKSTVSNDATGGVMGNVNYTVGGGLKISVTNAAPSGQEENAIDISIGNPTPNTNPFAAGSHTFKLSNQWGDMTIDTLNGDVELSTLLGDATLGTLAGNVECSTLIGNVEMSTLLGNAELSSSLVTTIDGMTLGGIRLGLGATQPLGALIRGPLLVGPGTGALHIYATAMQTQLKTPSPLGAEITKWATANSPPSVTTFSSADYKTFIEKVITPLGTLMTQWDAFLTTFLVALPLTLSLKSSTE
jgi:hypothetical protein